MLRKEITMKDVKAASFVPVFFYNKKVKQVLLILFTFFLVNITWVFFRAVDFDTAWRLLSSMFGADKNGIPVLPTVDFNYSFSDKYPTTAYTLFNAQHHSA